MNGTTRRLAALALSAGLLSGCALNGMGMSLPYMDARTGETGGASAGAPGSGSEQGTSLKGGEHDDNASFAAYLEYLRTARQQVGNAPWLDVTERYPLQVIDEASKSIPNATVTVKRGSELVLSARTPADGRIFFHPKAFPGIAESQDDLTIEVSKGASTVSRMLVRNGEAVEPFVLAGERGAIAPRVDLCFVLDVTGSMGDELSQIQASIGEIAFRITSLPGSPAVRYGLVAYRDEGDAFVTRSHEFTDDLALFKQRLNALAASGGGDYPEALNPALNEALTQLAWDEEEAVRLMFVVGDAPPRLDRVQDVPYTTSMVKALERGIKIVPLAASGLDALGEFVFRQLAQFTGGKFLFLTYGGGTSHQVGPVQENNLDDLVVGIVKAELGHLE